MRERVRDEVAAAVGRLWPDEVGFLQALVAERSVLGRTNGVQEVVEAKLRQLGLRPERVSIDVDRLRGESGFSPVDWSPDGTYDVAGRLPGAGGGRSLILNGHVDVVPSTPDDHWTHDPWGGEIGQGRLYGRGAADMKAGVAAMIYAVAAILEAGARLRGDLEIQTVVEEECSGNGTLALLAAGHRADASIIPEPLDQTLCTGHPGVLWCRIRVRGRGGHAERANASINAAERLWTMISAIRELEALVNGREQRHPAFSALPQPLNYNLGTLHAGDWPSSVPEEAVLEVRFAYNPGEQATQAQQRIERFLRRAAQRDEWLREVPPDITWFGFVAEPAIYDTDDELSRLIERHHLQVVGRGLERRPFAGTIDNRFFRLYAGMPTACYGPCGDRLHAPDESVVLETVRETTQVLTGTILDWCGVA